jgi:hypothetical protein
VLFYLSGWLGGDLGVAMVIENETPAYLPLVLKNYPSPIGGATETPALPTPTEIASATQTPTETATATQTPTFTLTPTEVITSSTFYLWSDGVIETTPGDFAISEHKCYTGCRTAERWDISLSGDMVGNIYEVFGKFVFDSIYDYSIPFRIILVHEGVEQILVEYILSGPGSKELTYIKWNGPDPTSTIGDTLIFEIDVSGEIGTLEIYYMGESSGIKVPAVNPSAQDTRFTQSHAISGSADAIYSADLDKDGDIDLVGADFSTQDINWWENSGSQSFTKHVIDSGLSIPMDNAVFAEDVDKDGDMDVLAVVDSSDNEEIAWYENDGSEGFTKQLIASNFLNPKSLLAIDLDKDGDVDILAGGSKLAWFQNDGSQVFTRTVIDNKNGISCVSVLDLDQDGDLDILGATLSGGIYWWRNDGGGTFVSVTIRTGSSTSTGSRSWVVGGDIDKDGDIDVIGTAALDSEVAWWENDGAEHFTKHMVSYGLSNPVAVSLVDVDGDGNLDILAGGAAVAWWENLGDRQFIRHLISSSDVKSMIATDIDKDGDVDFFKSNSLLTWEENLGD